MKNYIKSAGKPLASLLFSLILFQISPAQKESGLITWSAIPDAPQTFGKAAGGVIGDYFYVFGGQPHTRLALAYSLVDNSWMQSTPPNHGFLGSAFCVADNAIYRFSGTVGINTAEKFVPDGAGAGTWIPVAIPPSSINKPGISCCWDGGNFIYANNCDKSNNPTGYFARYNITDDSWEMLDPAPHPRRYAGMASVNNLIYLIGGIGSNTRDPHICQVFQPLDNSWSLIAPHPDSLNYTCYNVISDGSVIWTVGHGGGYGNFPASGQVHYYDPAADTWNAETELPVTRGFSLLGFQTSTSRIIQAGGSTGNGMRFVPDGRMGNMTPSEPGFLTGTVVDNWYSNPVADVEVSVYDNNNNPVGVDTTDENGVYTFTLNPGTYSALYTKYSYLDSTIANIVITSNNTTTLDVTLTFQHQCDYYVGDVNYSWSYNGLDVTYGANFFKYGAPAPYGCWCECTPGNWWYVCGDVNGDCQYNMLDIAYAVYYLKGGPGPIPCPDCPPINPAAKEKAKKASTASSSDRDSGSR